MPPYSKVEKDVLELPKLLRVDSEYIVNDTTSKRVSIKEQFFDNPNPDTYDQDIPDLRMFSTYISNFFNRFV